MSKDAPQPGDAIYCHPIPGLNGSIGPLRRAIVRSVSQGVVRVTVPSMFVKYHDAGHHHFKLSDYLKGLA